MSVFSTATLACPACGTEVEFEAVESLNADRRADLRAAILAETFQSQACAKCKTTFRLMPDMNYLDVGRGQWLAAHPLEDLARWQEVEAEDLATFERAYGPRASTLAQEIGAGLTMRRITFGWGGLREKILAAEQKLDDVTLELTKMLILGGVDDLPLEDGTEMRLVEVQPESLFFAWLDVVTEEPGEMMEIPRALYDDVAKDPQAWADLRSEFEGALYVDANRLMVEGTPLPPDNTPE